MVKISSHTKFVQIGPLVWAAVGLHSINDKHIFPLF